MIEEILEKLKKREAVIAIVGLGYVGRPTAFAFARVGYRVIGVDTDVEKVRCINDLGSVGSDTTDQEREIVAKGRLSATTDYSKAITSADVIIIIVPTPLTMDRRPDMRYVTSAGRSVGKFLRKGQLVILESTVYPGATEEVLKPLLEARGLKAGKDFGLAYCPERFNPGDPAHNLNSVARVVSAIGPSWMKVAAELYRSLTSGSIHEVRSITVAEGAKVIENIQRDLNIALMNELALIFERINLDVVEVIEAASTKWNFLRFKPGAGVGGHCLPVDPYYLLMAAERAGHHSKLITAGREVNDFMPRHILHMIIEVLNLFGRPIRGSVILILGFTYKENIDDYRQSPSLELARYLKAGGSMVRIFDPHVNAEELKSWGEPVESLIAGAEGADAMVIMTAHDVFFPLPLKDLASRMRRPVLIDGRRVISPDEAKKAGFLYRGVGRSPILDMPDGDDDI